MAELRDRRRNGRSQVELSYQRKTGEGPGEDGDWSRVYGRPRNQQEEDELANEPGRFRPSWQASQLTSESQRTV